MPRRPTVVEVAERAGVSIASVSRVLNGVPARKATEERVRAAVAELGYVPDATGRSLKHGRTLQIAFAVDALDNPVYTEMMRGVEVGLGGSGARLLVSSIGHEPPEVIALVDSLSRGYADGLIISPLRRTPEVIDALVAAPVPVVVIGDLGDHPPVDTVRTNSQAGVMLAYEHLIATGRHRIAFVNGPVETAPGQARRTGFTDAVERWGHGGPVVDADDFTVEAGESSWPALAAADPAAGDHRPDAVLAANDLLALGVLRAALNAGLRLPEDLAVVGVDDIGFARIFSPTLTSVSMGAHERGRLAAGLLLQRMSDPRAAIRSASVPPRLVVRESSAVGTPDPPSEEDDHR